MDMGNVWCRDSSETEVSTDGGGVQLEPDLEARQVEDGRAVKGGAVQLVDGAKQVVRALLVQHARVAAQRHEPPRVEGQLAGLRARTRRAQHAAVACASWHARWLHCMHAIATFGTGGKTSAAGGTATVLRLHHTPARMSDRHKHRVRAWVAQQDSMRWQPPTQPVGGSAANPGVTSKAGY